MGTKVRATGRTTRLLEDAVDKARYGAFVLVIANDERHASLLYELTMKFRGAQEASVFHGSRVYFSGSTGCVSFVPRSSPNVDMRRGSVSGAYADAVVYADHYACEEYLREVASWAEEQQHRFD